MKTYSESDLVNIGTGEDITIAEFARLVAVTVGYAGKIVFDPSKPYCTPRKSLDVSRLAKLDWRPSTSLQNGIRLAYQSFLSEFKSVFVRLNSDASVKRLKGKGQPLYYQSTRADVLAALEAVDLVAISEEDTPIKLITRIKPSVLVKGGDYTHEQVVGHEVVEACGGEVLLVEILAGHSTTSLVDRARGGKA